MAYVAPDFHALTALLRNHAAARIGAEPSTQLHVRPFDGTAAEKVASEWQALSDQYDNPDEKKHRETGYVLKQQQKMPESESYSLWNGHELLGISLNKCKSRPLA